MISYKINHLLCYFASWNSVKGKTFFISCEILSFHWNRRNAFVGDAFQWIENLCHKLFFDHILNFTLNVYLFVVTHIRSKIGMGDNAHFLLLICFVCSLWRTLFSCQYILFITIFCQGPDPRFLVIEIKVKQ